MVLPGTNVRHAQIHEEKFIILANADVIQEAMEQLAILSILILIIVCFLVLVGRALDNIMVMFLLSYVS